MKNLNFYYTTSCPCRAIEIGEIESCHECPYTEVTCQDCAFCEDKTEESIWMICGKTGEAVTKETSCWEGKRQVIYHGKEEG